MKVEIVKNILQMLDNNIVQFPDKTAFREVNRDIRYIDFRNEARIIATVIAKKLQQRNRPVVIFLDKGISCLSCMFATLYSGNFYTIVDVKMPKERIALIFETLDPMLLLTDAQGLFKAKELGFAHDICVYEDMLKEEVDDEILERAMAKMIDTDPAYVLFTSGSTGIPKGTVINHRSIIAYATWVKATFHINDQTIFGNQTPFYFSMSVLDIFTTISAGATMCVIPKMYFSFPAKLIAYMNEHKINTIYWVPSALGIVANLKALEEMQLLYLQTILFAGEVMPIKYLNAWKAHLPNALYANLYGPTEITDICTYYIVNRDFQEGDSLPIGKACNNCDVLVIKEDNTEAKDFEAGELCVRGSFLAAGYYNNPEKTAEVFIQNPLQSHYPELIYKTGDIVKYNQYGELIYLSRKDFQIKHMGYRIELGEIENAVFTIQGIISCACIYDDEARKIILFYQSLTIESGRVLACLKEKLPVYMCPNKVIALAKIPLNANGKIDRIALKNINQEDKRNGKIN